MRSLRFSTGVFLTALAAIVVLPSSTGWAEPTATRSACRARVIEELTTVHDEFRARIFGSRPDTEGKITVLTGGYADEEHAGIFETKYRLTSELIAPIVESYRSYRCRSISVCEAMKQSFQRSGALQIQPLGCQLIQTQTLAECQFSADDTGGTDDITALTGECGQLVETSLKLERSALRLAVAYDAGYRSILQLGGMIEWMQEDLPSSALRPVRDMINMLGKLHEIPCFIGQCDNADTSNVAP